jgi:hypothetical protein
MGEAVPMAQALLGGSGGSELPPEWNEEPRRDHKEDEAPWTW